MNDGRWNEARNKLVVCGRSKRKIGELRGGVGNA